jgi:predicted acylesterase/phospholipase RssA
MAISLIRTPVPELSQNDEFFPFEELAITLSGGGFRASAYSLGCLSYLHSLKYNGKTLLSRVKFIAGASGGAMTGLLFSTHNHMGIPFEETYRQLRDEILDGDKILKEAARIISDDELWKNYPTKNRNTINAFALAYQKIAFENRSFNVYWDSTQATIEEVCFNASELENGRAFRFQTDGDKDTSEIMGNNYLRLKDNNSAAVRKLRLGDIMAASSCFPAGFEPMVFPDDFAMDEKHQKELMAETQTAKNYDWEDYIPMNRSFALMDGGITDNQGIESLKLATERRKKLKGRGFDLVLICDVANYFMDPFEPLAETNEWWNEISIQFIINLHKYSIIVFWQQWPLYLPTTLPMWLRWWQRLRPLCLCYICLRVTNC